MRSLKSKKKRIFSGSYVAIITILTYVPILLTVLYSFNEAKSSVTWTGFSWKWYEELFRDRELREALLNSLVLAFLSCLFAAVLGTGGAIGVYKMSREPERYRVFGKINRVMEYITMLPIMIPEIIMGMVFLAVFSFMNLPFGMLTLLIAHTTFCIPYVFSMVKTRLAGMDKALEEAALDMGASPFQVFRDVTLPLILPGILSGVLLSFAMSFDDVVISIFVTGARVNTLPVKIYTRMKNGVTPEINALATVMLLVTVSIIGIGALAGSRKKR